MWSTWTLGVVVITSIVAIAANAHAQEPSKPSDKAETTKGLYMVTGLH